MSILSINIDKIYGTVSAADVAALKGEMEQGNRMLQDGSGKGSDFLGWVNLPESITSEELKTIRKCADNLVSLADVILVIGIGGSYLGAKAVLEALSDPFQLLRNQAGKTDRPVRRTEPERRLPVRVARRHPFLQDRRNRHFEIGYHDRTGRRFPPDQKRDRESLRRRRRCQAHRSHYGRRTRRTTDAGDQRRL